VYNNNISKVYGFLKEKEYQNVKSTYIALVKELPGKYL